MKRKNKGFTLIELLAVIVILGLLMAIAIPSVTKYITESRKKTLTTTLGNYIGALVNDVNDLEYTFTGTNTIYAVPIECIALERGGTNPFGHWYQANDSYFAYVLVQYDDVNSKYVYGFTFKDSAGYGLYPTIQGNINEKGSQIKTGYTINKPKTGDLTSLVTLAKWQESGFKVDSNTNLVVLEATAENETGDGVNTCTLQQKGDNYAQVEEEKTAYKDDKNKTDNELPILATYATNKFFWEFDEYIKNVTFEDSINIPASVSDDYKWDVSSTGNGMVMAYITPNAIDSTYYDLYIQGDGRLYANPNSSKMFLHFKNLDSINNIEILNTSKVTNMKSMFYNAGYNSTVFTLDLGNNFDTSKVTNMEDMFWNIGYSSTVFTLDLGDKFDTSKVENMGGMFYFAGHSSTVFTLDLGDKFDTSNVTKMNGMFRGTGFYCPVFTLDLGDKFDTSNVTKMGLMFQYTGRSSTVFTLDLGDKFDTKNVTSMAAMFQDVGKTSPVFTLDLGDKFDTSNVTSMQEMFSSAGLSSTAFTLDCSSWDVSNVTEHSAFNYKVTSKVIAPTWVQ